MVRRAGRLAEGGVEDVDLVGDVELGCALYGGNVLLVVNVDACDARDGEAVFDG